jgi:hypothetical protein
MNLQPGLFAVGTLASIESLSLVLGVGRGSAYDFLVSVHANNKWAVAINRSGGFNSFECSEAVNHWGIIVPNVLLEADLGSRVDFYDSAHGSLVWSDENLSIFVKPGRYGGSTNLVPVLGSLDRQDTSELVSFSKWRVLVRDSLKETEVYSIDVSPPAMEG